MSVMVSTFFVSSSAESFNTKLPLNYNTDANLISRFQLCTGLNIGRKKDRHINKSLHSVRSSEAIIQKTEKKHGKSSRKGNKGLILSEGRDADENYGLICPGCGVFMQDADPNHPGYFQKRKVEKSMEATEDLLDDDFDVDEDELEDFEDDIEGNLENIDKDVVNWDAEDWESDFEDEEDKYSREVDGFVPAGLGYGNITEETLERSKKKKVSKAERKKMAREAQREKEEVTVCARCHSLRNYGQVKNPTAENLIPDFDFDRLISTRLMKPTGTADSTVVVMVVDCVDFDGSFPKRAAKSLFKALTETKEGSKLCKRLPKLVLVATKVDLLTSQISPARLDRWVRHRARENGAPKLSGVYMVSSKKDLGVKNLLAFVKELAGPRGNVWVVGAQNAGKSTLINAFSKKEGVKVAKITEAPIPGTTLGILRIGGILPAKAKMYDTPGLLHPYLMSVRLNRDEQKMVEIRKELQPRTFRIKAIFTLIMRKFQYTNRDPPKRLCIVKRNLYLLIPHQMAGQAIHVGCLVRLDLDQASVETIYVTVWASPSISLHMGKIENAYEIKNNHAGIRLQPPIGVERVSELGEWVKRDIKACGTSWDMNNMDVAVAGLGWFSLGLKGEASLSLWTYEGIQVDLREPLVLDRAPFLERPGFWLPKAISDAIGNQTRLEARSRRKDEEGSTDLLSGVHTGKQRQ
ncbi:P-loop containing nucleoside triphosphatehydrolases superfamily protein [Striga asiatica]|uniref:P-loop containing nucleoside triphosphatehydrolases superfamily protein n=1 Tax=Striga asiatica TaxID=4170 RepID=A0A5A7QU38_STRAF|nr:P-loop containing nucleoside triphosphatehydrolases superfamily protein [Striga asiatica]